MNSVLPTTAMMTNPQQAQQTQYQSTEPYKMDKVDKVDKIDKEIILTQPTSPTTPLQSSTELRILRIKEVAEKLSIGKSTIYDWLNKKSPRYDASFPKPIKLSSKSIGWLSSEIDIWLLARAEQTRVSDFS